MSSYRFASGLLVVMAGLLLPDHHAPNTIEIDLVRIFGVIVDHVAVTQHSAPTYVEAALVVVVLALNRGSDLPSPRKIYAHASPPLRWAARAARAISNMSRSVAVAVSTILIGLSCSRMAT